MWHLILRQSKNEKHKIGQQRRSYPMKLYDQKDEVNGCKLLAKRSLKFHCSGLLNEENQL